MAYESSLAALRETLQQTGPVIASVMYKNSEAVPAELPVLHGAPVEATDGHLVVVRGMVRQDGKDYIVVNDPAGDGDSVRRLYATAEFEKAWTHYLSLPKKKMPLCGSRSGFRQDSCKQRPKPSCSKAKGANVSLWSCKTSAYCATQNPCNHRLFTAGNTGGIVAKTGKGR